MESKSSLVPSLVSFCVQLTQNKNKVLIFFRLGEGCTHISGLLFSLEANTKKLKDVPCTSKHCVWNKGGNRKKKPGKCPK